MLNSNPYRFLGVISNSGIKNIQKNLSKIKAYSKIGKHLSLPYELSFFNLQDIDRSESLINEAENKILLDSNKVKHSLFWFNEANPIDKIALENLNNGNFEKSETIWRKVIKENIISESNFSAYNNLSTLLLLRSLSDKKNDKFENSNTSILRIKEALKLKSELIFSDHLYDLSKLITGNEIAIKKENVLEFFNENISQLFNENFSSIEISTIIKDSNNELSNSFNFSLISEPLESLNELINDANIRLNDDHSKGVEIGKDLIKNSVSSLKLLKNILDTDDLKYQTISDKLANQIIQCGILCFNKTNDDQDYISSYKYAKSISFKDSTKERANTTIKHCEDETRLGTCCVCNTNKVDRSNPSKTVMYKETGSSWLSNTVSYNTMTLTIYFCKNCNSKMEDSEKTAGYISWGFAAIAVIIMLLNGLGWFSLILGFPALGIGSFIGDLFSSESSSINKQPLVKEHFKLGYSFNQPGK